MQQYYRSRSYLPRRNLANSRRLHLQKGPMSLKPAWCFPHTLSSACEKFPLWASRETKRLPQKHEITLAKQMNCYNIIQPKCFQACSTSKLCAAAYRASSQLQPKILLTTKKHVFVQLIAKDAGLSSFSAAAWNEIRTYFLPYLTQIPIQPV